ncbi:hypothetical protein CP980_33960 [Streptomyces vinaceus]|uniref:ROK family protein n=1 Tax=Streptomyces vinaceus TaxID=1960 RepID=A0A5J6JH89_STRVI|nr:hypothetical protein CP980_33960 [Streptomyces vinaceus]GHE45179.1 hypothetical protein GCM10017778_30910 [Streptomyces vinaceus]
MPYEVEQADDLVLGIDGGRSRLRAALAVSAGGPPSAMARAGAAPARSVQAPVLEDRLGSAIRRVLHRERAAQVRSVIAGFAGRCGCPAAGVLHVNAGLLLPPCPPKTQAVRAQAG